jgi:hypothetical protein
MVIEKVDLQRRRLAAKYPRRSVATFTSAPDHNPDVLEDCARCHGSGQHCVETDGEASLSECSECGGTGTTYTVVSFFSNQAPEQVVVVDANGWVTCPCCSRRFSLRDQNAWTGLRHIGCGQRLRPNP